MSLLSKTARQVRINFDPRLRVVRAANANSLCGPRRLLGLRRVAHAAALRGLPGEFVECGTFRGGSAAVIAERLFARRPDLDMHLFDVFTGMPRPGPNDPREAWDDVGKFVASPEIVRATFDAAGVPTDRLHIHQGLYQETLPGFDSPALCFLHVDCDWYESVRLVLEKFYDHVSPGGTIVFDDYGTWSGCRKAVDEFLAAHSIGVQLTPIDKFSHYFVKP